MDVARPRVIVVDDHPRVLTVATSLLAQSCQVVASLSDGVSAIQAAARLRPDVVVLDVFMPGLNGFQTCEQLRLSGSDARIVMLSADAHDEVVLEGLARGASGFVAKSRMAHDLIDAVGHVHAGRAFVPATRLLPRWRRPDGQRHHLQLHTTDRNMVNGVAAFLDSALNAGDSVIQVTTAAHREAIDLQLSSRGHDVSQLLGSNRYAYMDAETAADLVLQHDLPDEVHVANVLDSLLEQPLRSSAHVYLFGEIGAVLHARGFVYARLQLERIVNDYAASRRISVLCSCAVDLRRKEGTEFATRLCNAHSTVVPAT